MGGADTMLHQIFQGIVQNPIVSGLGILVLLALVQNFFLWRKVTRLLRGGDGKTLEGTINTLREKVAVLETHAAKATLAFENVDARLAGSIRGVSVNRFDPFQNAGGQQSFAVALLNEKGNGTVIAGIHARDGVRVYAKNVSNFKSERELSAEEKLAIDDAKKKLTI
jgi:hypothetical protein